MTESIAVSTPAFLRPEVPGQATPISVQCEDVQSLMAGGAQVVDVLSPEQYGEAHLPGAVNLPLAELDEASAARLRRDEPVVVYCYDDQ